MLGVGNDDVEDVGSVAVEHFLDRFAEFFLFVDAPAWDAETGGDLDEIGVEAAEIIGAADVVFVAEDGVAADAVVETIFPLHDHAEVLVVQDHRFGSDFFDFRGGEFLHVHEEGAVAVDVDDLAVWTGYFRAEGGRIAEAHGAESERADEAAGIGVIVELGGPHLVLADAGGDDGFAFGQFEENANRLLGEDVRAFFVAEGMFLHPAAGFRQPFRAVGGGEVAAFHQLVQPAERIFNIRDNRISNDFVFVVLGGVDVDVDNGRFGGEFRDIARDAVVEADAEREQEIAFVDGPISGGRSVHPEPFEGKFVGFREASEAHQRCGDGDLGALGELEEFGGGVAGNDAAADVEGRFFRVGDEIENFQKRFVAGFSFRWVGLAKGDFLGKDRLDAGLLDVLGNVDDDRSGAAGGGELERFFENAGKVFGLQDEVAVFDDRQGHAEEVGFLEGAFADELLVNLAGDRDQRGAVHVGVGDRGDEVGRAGAAGGHANSRFAGGAGVAFGGEGTALFVAGKNGAKPVAFRQGLMQLLRGAAGISEYDLYSLPHHAFDGDFGALHFRADIWFRKGD